ncbi:unnamed protein product [Thelazia callipaeda]|uniref:Transmembrane protein n=1 Tax=Thelazia callipaeda TaxID=103827 RepID=A0A0N5CX12_THECL|nr:unnamed protein product [Thelazia callipaeda]
MYQSVTTSSSVDKRAIVLHFIRANYEQQKGGVMKRGRESKRMVVERNAFVRAVKALLALLCFYALCLLTCLIYTIRRQYRNVRLHLSLSAVFVCQRKRGIH